MTFLLDRHVAAMAEAFRFAMAGGHWVTIDGTHIYLDDEGRVTIGPPSLKGSKLADSLSSRALHHPIGHDPREVTAPHEREGEPRPWLKDVKPTDHLFIRWMSALDGLDALKRSAADMKRGSSVADYHFFDAIGPDERKIMDEYHLTDDDIVTVMSGPHRGRKAFRLPGLCGYHFNPAIDRIGQREKRYYDHDWFSLYSGDSAGAIHDGDLFKPKKIKAVGRLLPDGTVRYARALNA